MSKTENFSTGRKGEEIAVQLLKKKGYKIIERNWQSRFGEIDIIAKEKGSLIFVEVKTKVGQRFGSPEEMFGRDKAERVRRMAMSYESYLDIARRIDMVAVVLNYSGQVERVDHYESVY